VGSDRLERKTRQILKQDKYEECINTLSTDAEKNTFICSIANKVIRAICAIDVKDRASCVRACNYVWAAPPEEIPEQDKPYVISKLTYWHNKQR